MIDASIAQTFCRLERVKNHKNRGKWALGLSRDEPSHKQFGNVAMFLRYFTIARTRCWHGTALSIPALPLFPSIKSPISDKKSSDALPPMKAATNEKSTQFCSDKFLHYMAWPSLTIDCCLHGHLHDIQVTLSQMVQFTWDFIVEICTVQPKFYTIPQTVLKS